MKVYYREVDYRVDTHSQMDRKKQYGKETKVGE